MLRRVFRATARAVLLIVAASVLLCQVPAAASPGAESIVIELGLLAYDIVQDAEGFDRITAEGFTLTGVPGAPLLPRKVINAGLPPNTALDSIRLEIINVQTEVLPGTYRLRTAVPDQTSTGMVANSQVATGANPTVSLLPPGQMRRYRFARVTFEPFSYDPASGTLSVARSVTVRISYDLADDIGTDTALLADTAMDDEAREKLVNFDQVRAWYHTDDAPEGASVTYDYVIITTNAIASGSSQLNNFVAHKRSKGFSVLVVTETDYGGLVGQTPNGIAEKIRKWLQDHYESYGIRYVLLIGNPDPDNPTDPLDSVGDVPMKMCWPHIDDNGYIYSAPTDYFYADLTGNWDINGDGWFGVYGYDYPVTGGVDLANEVYVGRIPVYNNDYTTLDAILLKTIAYENDPSFWSWRRSTLLPMSFSTSDYDGAPLAEQMIDDYLDPTGFSSWTMYQQGNSVCGPTSAYPSKQELLGGTIVRDRWSANAYGLVMWWGHGSQTSAVVGYDNCWDGTLFDNSQYTSLDDAYPAFVYQNSCLNGYPEASNNLQYSLLKNGAVATVGATRVSWFNVEIGYGQFAGSTTNSGIGYEYAKRLVAFQRAGDALYNTKSSMTPELSTRLMNLFDFNLYGDPALAMLTVPPTFDQHFYLPIVMKR